MTRDIIQATGGLTPSELTPIAKRPLTPSSTRSFDDHLQRATQPSPTVAAPEKQIETADTPAPEINDQDDADDNTDLTSQQNAAEDARTDDQTPVAAAAPDEEPTEEPATEVVDSVEIAASTAASQSAPETAEASHESDEAEDGATESSSKNAETTSAQREPILADQVASGQTMPEDSGATISMADRPQALSKVDPDVSATTPDEDDPATAQDTSKADTKTAGDKGAAASDANIAAESGNAPPSHVSDKVSGPKRSRSVESSAVAVERSDETNADLQFPSPGKPGREATSPTNRESTPAQAKIDEVGLQPEPATDAEVSVKSPNAKLILDTDVNLVDRSNSDAQSTRSTPESVVPTATDRPYAVQRTTIDARSASAEAPSAEAGGNAKFVQRVAGAFRAAQDRGGEVRLRLSPPELGSLRIELTVKNGALTARLEAETQAARTILLENLPALRDRLAEQDIRIEKFDVDVREESSRGSYDPAGDDPHRDGGGEEEPSGGASKQALRTEQQKPIAAVRHIADGDRQLNVVV